MGRSLTPWRRLPAGRWPLLVVVALTVVGTAGDQVQAYRFAQLAVYAVLLLSLVVLSGWAGSVSLLSAAHLGVGAFAAATLLERTPIPFVLVVPLAGLVAAVGSLVVGIPVLRLPPVVFVVMTLAAAALLQEVVFTSEWCCGGGVRGVVAPRPSFATTDKGYLVLCSATLGLVCLALLRLRTSRIGRALIATRDEPGTAEAFGVNTTKARLVAFALSGFIAGLAGALFAGLLGEVSNRSGVFDLERGIELFGLATLGGISSLAGPLIGATVKVLPMTWWPEWEHLGNLQLLIAGPIAVAVYLRSPDGIAGLLRRRQVEVEVEVEAEPKAGAPAAPSAAPAASAVPVASRPGAALRCRDLVVDFDGLRAVDGVSFDAAPGQIVGILGANGSGKSTVLDVISGRTAATGGEVVLEVDGVQQDVLDLLAYQRAGVGIGRTFQDVRLFDTMSVRETLLVAAHTRVRTGLLASLAVSRRSADDEREAAARVGGVAELLGLTGVLDRSTAELSFGMARIVELGAILVLSPRLLLLDEPAAGLAHGEALALRALLLQVRRATGATIVLVEHDVGLVAEVADRLIAIDAGRVLADGPPAQVLADPDVRSAYLGAPG